MAVPQENKTKKNNFIDYENENAESKHYVKKEDRLIKTEEKKKQEMIYVAPPKNEPEK